MTSYTIFHADSSENMWGLLHMSKNCIHFTLVGPSLQNSRFIDNDFSDEDIRGRSNPLQWRKGYFLTLCWLMTMLVGRVEGMELHLSCCSVMRLSSCLKLNRIQKVLASAASLLIVISHHYILLLRLSVLLVEYFRRKWSYSEWQMGCSDIKYLQLKCTCCRTGFWVYQRVLKDFSVLPVRITFHNTGKVIWTCALRQTF